MSSLSDLFESQLFKLPAWHPVFARLSCAQARSFSGVSDWFLALSCPDKMPFLKSLPALCLLSYGWVSYILTRKEDFDCHRHSSEGGTWSWKASTRKKNGYSKRNARQPNPKYQRCEARGRNSGQVQNEKKVRCLYQSTSIGELWPHFRTGLSFTMYRCFIFFGCPIQSGILSLIKIKQAVETEPKPYITAVPSEFKA